MTYSLPRWALDPTRERRINDQQRIQAEEQRAALERQGLARTDTIRSTYKGIADSIDKGVEGYDRGKQSKRADEAHSMEKMLSEEQLAGSKVNRGIAEMEKAETEKKYAARAPDYHTRTANLDLATAEEGLASSKAGRRLTEANIAAVGKDERRLDQSRAEQELNATMDTIQSLTAQRSLVENQMRGPLSEEGRAQAESQLQTLNANINQLQMTAQSLSQKAGLESPALLVRGAQAAGRHSKAQKETLASERMTQSIAPGYTTARDQIIKANEDAAAAMQAVNELADYDRSTIGTDAADKAYNKFLATLSPDEQEYVKSASYITGTPTSRMRKVLESKVQNIETAIRSSEALVTAENATTLQPSIQAAKQQLIQLKQAVQRMQSGGGASNAPFPGRKQSPAVLTGGQQGGMPGQPPSLR